MFNITRQKSESDKFFNMSNIKVVVVITFLIFLLFSIVSSAVVCMKDTNNSNNIYFEDLRVDQSGNVYNIHPANKITLSNGDRVVGYLPLGLEAFSKATKVIFVAGTILGCSLIIFLMVCAIMLFQIKDNNKDEIKKRGLFISKVFFCLCCIILFMFFCINKGLQSSDIKTGQTVSEISAGSQVVGKIDLTNAKIDQNGKYYFEQDNLLSQAEADYSKSPIQDFIDYHYIEFLYTMFVVFIVASLPILTLSIVCSKRSEST